MNPLHVLRYLRKLSPAIIFGLLLAGCGSNSASPGSSAGGGEAQGKMSPEEVQKEIQKLSPAAPGKGKAKAKTK